MTVIAVTDFSAEPTGSSDPVDGVGGADDDGVADTSGSLISAATQPAVAEITTTRNRPTPAAMIRLAPR
jgi:hypothetical protein